VIDPRADPHLKKRLHETPPESRPDAALVVESGVYVSWHSEVEGRLGIFAFCIDCSYLARNVMFAEPDLLKYVAGRTDATPTTSGKERDRK
jgi:hypothetical protein